ncbi:hypothetical protein RclHR1_05100005 [Rhizophagus clarus]|uniref:MARVEL domain-containing protein n=1 Tax=Rhizophagus clarus TaxID=94130 RepID=A0A2Z6SEG0_9GLOM|nr:hypothetical protein RclHR1_05100005 [Rhizophagus clarus]GES86434.1 hypothetical protein GLOIN_2v1728844 [Rhizophagus clarus]
MASDRCCWIEMRICLIFLTIINFFISIFFAIVFIVNPDVLTYGLPRGLTIFFGVLFILVALVSIFGILGTLLGSAGGTKIHSIILWGFVIIYLIIIIIVVINMIRTKQEAINLCIKHGGKGGTQSVGESAESTNNNTKGSLSTECNEFVNVLVKSICLVLVALFTASLAQLSSRHSHHLYIQRKTKPNIKSSN